MPQTKLILKKLRETYENPVTELKNWNTPIQFMVCVILSAQATDKGVNKVTSALFDKYPTARNFANANIKELMDYVKSINYYKTKAQRIIDACQFVLDEYGGELPPDIDKLVKIPGVGRKSANVILHEVMGESQGIVVDTHVTRVSFRLRLTSYDNQKDAVKIEAELKKIISKQDWRFYSSAAVLHGRYTCKARKPMCDECNLKDICPSAGRLG